MTVLHGENFANRAESPTRVLGFALSGSRTAVYGIGLFSANINVLALTGSLFMLQVYDRVLPSRSVPTLVVLPLLTAALFAFYGLLDLFRGRVLVRVGARLDAAISPRVYQAIVRLPLSRIPNSSNTRRDSRPCEDSTLHQVIEALKARVAFGSCKKSGIGGETHKMMLDHYQQTKIALVSYSPKALGFHHSGSTRWGSLRY
jgi:hypothetical protein